MNIEYVGSTKIEGDRETIMLPFEAEAKLSGRIEQLVSTGNARLIEYGYVPEFGVTAMVGMTATPYGDTVKITYMAGGVPLLIVKAMENPYDPTGWQITDTQVPETGCKSCGLDGMCGI